MSNFKTPQEEFWAGAFGNSYVERNRGEKIIASNIAMFARILGHTRNISSVIEFGANIGLNLNAIGQILPDADMSAVEINQAAVDELMKSKRIHVHPMSILDFVPERQYDLALIKGVMIHINPEKLPAVYELLYQVSTKYICIAEYYNPTPVSMPYRGHQERLFKRDFAGEMLDRYPDVVLVDYGFVYHRDNNVPQDDITWFLLEKRAAR